MAKQKIIITQVLRIEREATIEVEAETPEKAAALFGEGEIDNPTEGWTTTREELQHEEARVVGLDS